VQVIKIGKTLNSMGPILLGRDFPLLLV